MSKSLDEYAEELNEAIELIKLAMSYVEFMDTDTANEIEKFLERYSND